MFNAGDRVMSLIDDKFLGIVSGDTEYIAKKGVLGLVIKLDKNDSDWYMSNEQIMKI